MPGAELRALDRTIANLPAAIEDGVTAPPLVRQPAGRHKEREALLAAIGTAEANAKLVLDRKAIEPKVLDQVQARRALLTKESRTAGNCYGRSWKGGCGSRQRGRPTASRGLWRQAD